MSIAPSTGPFHRTVIEADPAPQEIDNARRRFFAAAGNLTTAALASGALGFSALVEASNAAAPGTGTTALKTEFSGANKRSREALAVRRVAAFEQFRQPPSEHPTNGDEDRFPNWIGSFSKALPHNAYGEVKPAAMRALIKALKSGEPAAFEAIPLKGTVKLANPQATYAFALEGPDSHHLGMPAAPEFASAHAAAELAEVYWRALTRDIPFADYETDPLIARAADDLALFSDYHGPNNSGKVAPRNIFRGNTRGDLLGPFLSQFLWAQIPYGLAKIDQQYRLPGAGQGFMTSVEEWLAIQNGAGPSGSIVVDNEPRYICTGRDLAEWVHVDFPYQAFLNATLILLGYGPSALDAGNPYRGSRTEVGFITFGAAHVLDLVARVARQALAAAWYQKWALHRRVRPEAFAGSVHFHMTGHRYYPIHPDLLHCEVLAEVFHQNGNYLLPMAYPEGCPTHPSYPAGHATISGACATVLKAFFDESFEIPNPVQATRDGSSLEPYDGALTIGGEVNKLAANCSLGRDTGGVHYRSDGIEGLLLGEKVAIGMLTDYRATHNEAFAGFSLTRFDGSTVSVGS